MKTARTLKKLIDVFYFLLIFSGVIYIAFIFSYLISNNDFLSRNFDIKGILNNDKVLYVFSILYVILFLLFIKAVYHLRKTMPILIGGNYFTNSITKEFKSAGNYFVTVGTIALILHFVSQMYLNGVIWFGIDNQIYTFLFLIIIGLFFMFLCEVFEKAKRLQKENDLTI